MEVASDPALLFLGDLCDHARERRERRGMRNGLGLINQVTSNE